MERYNRRYKRPKSRSEELKRHAKAEENIARRLGELPPKQTVFQRIKQKIIRP